MLCRDRSAAQLGEPPTAINQALGARSSDCLSLRLARTLREMVGRQSDHLSRVSPGWQTRGAAHDRRPDGQLPTFTDRHGDTGVGCHHGLLSRPWSTWRGRPDRQDTGRRHSQEAVANHSLTSRFTSTTLITDSLRVGSPTYTSAPGFHVSGTANVVIHGGRQRSRNTRMRLWLEWPWAGPVHRGVCAPTHCATFPRHQKRGGTSQYADRVVSRRISDRSTRSTEMKRAQRRVGGPPLGATTMIPQVQVGRHRPIRLCLRPSG